MDAKCRALLARAIRVLRDANEFVATGQDLSIAISKKGRCRIRDGPHEMVWNGRSRSSQDLAWYKTHGVHTVLTDPSEWALCCMFDPDPESVILGGAAEFELVDALTVDASVVRTDGRRVTLSRLSFGVDGLLYTVETGKRSIRLSPRTGSQLPDNFWSGHLSVEQGEWIGRQAPDLPLEPDGSLSDCRGSVVVLDFYPGDDLVAEIVINDELEREYPGVRVITVVQGPTKGVAPRRDLIHRRARDYVNTFRVERTPAKIILDRSGIVRVYQETAVTPRGDLEDVLGMKP